MQIFKNILFTVIVALCLTGCQSEDMVVTSVNSEEADASYTDSYTGGQDTTGAMSDAGVTDAEVSDSGVCAVYVCGAVCKPGVYYLSSGSIKQDALDAAGGFTEIADTSYVNLAEHISDGEKIYFPEQGEALEDDTAEAADSRVNINTASESELMGLPGIGSSKARAIIAYREANGDYSSIEAVMKVNGIKEGVYENIKDYIRVE